ncbi:MAG: hypothetical protein FJ241_05820 [Nitrospira sp.]|nr:hypothetical protein [Nitrospira sp.]
MPPKNKNKIATPVEAHVHKKDKRKNIPTAELQDFVKEDEAKPKKILYPCDSSLDQQLIWTEGKKHTSFEVPTVSLHIHEPFRTFEEGFSSRRIAWGKPTSGNDNNRWRSRYYFVIKVRLLKK